MNETLVQFAGQIQRNTTLFDCHLIKRKGSVTLCGSMFVEDDQELVHLIVTVKERKIVKRKINYHGQLFKKRGRPSKARADAVEDFTNENGKDAD